MLFNVDFGLRQVLVEMQAALRRAERRVAELEQAAATGPAEPTGQPPGGGVSATASQVELAVDVKVIFTPSCICH
jgi:hypothetical protein